MLTLVSPAAPDSSPLHHVLSHIDALYTSSSHHVFQVVYINGLLPAKLSGLLAAHDYAFAADHAFLASFHYIHCQTLAHILDVVQHPPTDHVTQGRLVIVDEPASVGFRSGHDYAQVNAELAAVLRALKRDGLTAYVLDEPSHFLAVQVHRHVVV